MVAELNILTEWIPEQMEPGTLFILENAGQVGEPEDPYWAVLSCPECGTLGLITRRQMSDQMQLFHAAADQRARRLHRHAGGFARHHHHRAVRDGRDSFFDGYSSL